VTEWQRYLDDRQDTFLDELIDFVRIPSISSLSEHLPDVERAAEWVAARMRQSGIDNVEILPTGGHPVVYGEHLHAPGRPTLLIYGHFDVQPVDPLELWEHPPFEPHLEEGRLYGRGATDDKGNMLIPLLAVEALLETAGELPLNLKFLFEGQEEIGSPQLPDFIEAQRERLSCDLVVSADGMQWDTDQPAIWVGLKGLCSLQVEVKGADQDLHSGSYGGMVQNPIHALTTILASMRDPGGRILVEGFYDAVVNLSNEERQQIAKIPFDEAEEAARLGVPTLVAEAGYTPREHSWARPTLEVNGIWGGFQGEGTKTVLPSEAGAKITCRLVVDQDPTEIAEAVRRHVELHTPAGVRVSVTQRPDSAWPYLIPWDHPGNRAAHTVLREVYGREPFYVRTGGSIPFCALMLEKLGVYTVNFAFGLGDEQLHAPNEFYRLASFARGQGAYVRLLQRLGETGLEGL